MSITRGLHAFGGSWFQIDAHSGKFRRGIREMGTKNIFKFVEKLTVECIEFRVGFQMFDIGEDVLGLGVGCRGQIVEGYLHGGVDEVGEWIGVRIDVSSGYGIEVNGVVG